MKKIKIGIIGQGRSGRDIHAATALKLPDQYEILAISDPLEERRVRAQNELHCEVYADYRDLIKQPDLDLIVNATPSDLHVPVSLEILNGGKHVLCEKPLARRLADVDALIAASQRSGKQLLVYQQLHFAPAFEQFCRIIDSGVIGRIVQASFSDSKFSRRWDWQTLQEKDGGNLLNLGPHLIDQALRVIGYDTMPEVICLMDRAVSSGDAEDFVKVILHGKGLPKVDIEVSSCNTFPNVMFQAQGTLGGIKGSHQRLDWKYYKPEEAEGHELVSEAFSRADGTPAYCSEELIWYEGSWEAEGTEKNPYQSGSTKFYKEMHQSLLTGEPLKVTAANVRKQVAVIEQCFSQNPEFSINHIS